MGWRLLVRVPGMHVWTDTWLSCSCPSSLVRMAARGAAMRTRVQGGAFRIARTTVRCGAGAGAVEMRGVELPSCR